MLLLEVCGDFFPVGVLGRGAGVRLLPRMPDAVAAEDVDDVHVDDVRRYSGGANAATTAGLMEWGAITWQ